jgi:hypothetical protein
VTTVKNITPENDMPLDSTGWSAKRTRKMLVALDTLIT